MIYIDDRVGSKELQPLIPPTTPSSLTRLQSGDAAWMGEGPEGPVFIGMERKRINDLVSSIDSGRLSGSQLLLMQRSYWRSYLVVEGIWRPDPATGILQTYAFGKWVNMAHGRRQWMAREVSNYLNRLQVMLGIMVKQTATVEETAMWLAWTYHWWQKDWDKHEVHHFYNRCQPQYVQLFRPGIVERIAKELEGVGWERATEVGKRFRLPVHLALASEHELMDVPGIGKKLARSIRSEMQGE